MLFTSGQVLAQLSVKKTAIFFVDQAAAADGDGTTLHPFQKIMDALSTAKRNNQAVIVNISTGSYPENLVITGNTTLRGMTKPGSQKKKSTVTILLGSITNNNPTELKIEDLHIANAAAPGAVVVNNHEAKTILRNVTISRATRYGIFQRGGTLTVNDATIIFTSPGVIPTTGKSNIEETVCYGTGIFIKNTIASLVNVQLQRNVQGLMADGATTIVEITNMLAEKNRPALIDYFFCDSSTILTNGLAAIEARNGATLRVQGIKILDNIIRGLSIHDGARFIGTDVIILRTRSVLCVNGGNRGGMNVTVMNGGAWLELTRFEIGYADMCGLYLVNANGRCADGNVHHNLLGIWIRQQPADFNFDAFITNVTFRDNERVWDFDHLPIPDDGLFP